MRSATSSRTGRRCERCTPRSSRPARAHRAGLPPRDPRRAAEQSAQQAIALDSGDRFEDIEDAYAGADHILGRLVKVTPSRRWSAIWHWRWSVRGHPADFAEDPARYDIPDSVIGFLRGELGDPPGGWPEPLRTKALRVGAGQAGAAAVGRG
jgi:pyruvate carboxylase